jgi:hypothetical protein
MYEIRKIKVLPLAKFGAIFGGLAVVIFLVFIFIVNYTLNGYYYNSFASDFAQPLMFIGIAVLIGFVFGAILAAIYNLLAPSIGGVEMEIVIKEEKQ